MANYKSHSDRDKRSGREGGVDAFSRDLTLLRRWRDGDRKSGEELLSLYLNILYRDCLQLGVTKEDEIREVHQEVVLDLLEHLEDLPERIHRSFAGYLSWRTRKIIVKGRFKRRTIEPLEGPLLKDYQVNRIEIKEAIRNCLKRLTQLEKKIFELRYIDEMSLKEIASALRNTVNAVGQTIFRLTHKMQDCLKKEGFF